MYNTNNDLVNEVLSRDGLSSSLYSMAYQVKLGIIDHINLARAYYHELNNTPEKLRARTIEKINNEYLEGYAKIITSKKPYYYMHIYLDIIVDKYYGYDSHKLALAEVIYPYFKMAIIDYMEGNSRTISFHIIKQVLKDKVNSLFTANVEDDDEDYKDDDEDYEDVEEKLNTLENMLNNTSFISYNPAYWIPDNFKEFNNLVYFMMDDTEYLYIADKINGIYW